MHKSLISDKRIKLFCPFNNLKTTTTTTNFSWSNLLCLPRPHFSAPFPVKLLGKPSLLLPALSLNHSFQTISPWFHGDYTCKVPSDAHIAKSSNQSLFHLAQLTTPSSWTHCPHLASSPYRLHCWLFLSFLTSSEQPKSRLNPWPFTFSFHIHSLNDFIQLLASPRCWQLSV